MADLVLDQPIACPEGFADFSYNWTGVAGFPNGGPLSNGQEIGPNIELVGFNETMGGPCIGAAIWNITNNDPASPGADTDLQTCPNNNVASAPFCNILVVQQDGSAAGKVNDCNPGGGFAQINLQFTVPITLIALNFWDIEQNDDLQIFWNSDGTPGNAFAPGTGGVDGTGSELFLNKEKVTTWSLRFTASGGVNGVRYCGTTTTTTPGGDVTGDPHIRTLDGNHYLLLNQGTFSLWRFSGQANVDWQIYTRYSGHQSFTKGLLLVDQSAKRFRRALEITAKDCKWRTRTEGNEWEVVQHPELFSGEGTALNLTRHHLRFFMNNKHDENDGHDGQREVAVLSFRCRPTHYMNLAIKMRRAEDVKFVEGELRAARKPHGASMLQMTDAEFEQHKSWTALGGSGDASVYLEAADEAATSFVSKCQESQKAEAAKICAKHLGEMQKETRANADFFSDCVYDVCNGAGEVAAELAAELLASSQEVM